MPPATGGGPDAGSNLCRPELGVADADVAAGIVLPARSPATEPTARSADTACSVAAGDGSAGWAAQRPSALTISSAPTGPCGPRLIPLLAVGRAQSGLANSSTGLENQPPSFWSSNTRAAPVHPPTPSAAAQASAMLKRAKWAELRNKRPSPNRFISLVPKTYFASSPWQRASLGRPKGCRRDRPLAGGALAESLCAKPRRSRLRTV
jgi:hypothetical protein